MLHFVCPHFTCWNTTLCLLLFSFLFCTRVAPPGLTMSGGCPHIPMCVCVCEILMCSVTLPLCLPSSSKSLLPGGKATHAHAHITAVSPGGISRLSHRVLISFFALCLATQKTVAYFGEGFCFKLPFVLLTFLLYSYA